MLSARFLLLVGGYLPDEDRSNPVAIKAAIEGVISDVAFELEQGRSKGRERTSLVRPSKRRVTQRWKAKPYVTEAA